MDSTVNAAGRWRPLLSPALCLSLGLGLSLSLTLTLPAQAQQLSDPTRPPAALAAAPAGAGEAEVVETGPRLQTILIDHAPAGRRLAVIDGVTVRVGTKLGDATVVRITESGVVLRRGKNLETLTLFPKPAKAVETGGKPQ